MPIPKKWKEWTRFTLVKPKPDLTLAQLSYTIGEGVTEDFSRGATEFIIKFEKDRVTIVCNKGGLDTVTGYNPQRFYKDVFEEPE